MIKFQFSPEFFTKISVKDGTMLLVIWPVVSAVVGVCCSVFHLLFCLSSPSLSHCLSCVWHPCVSHLSALNGPYCVVRWPKRFKSPQKISRQTGKSPISPWSSLHDGLWFRLTLSYHLFQGCDQRPLKDERRLSDQWWAGTISRHCAVVTEATSTSQVIWNQ